MKINSKEEAIDHLVDLMVKGGEIQIAEEHLAREANGTTGIGGGIAIPRSKEQSNEQMVGFYDSTDGVDYETMDGESSTLFL